MSQNMEHFHYGMVDLSIQSKKKKCHLISTRLHLDLQSVDGNEKVEGK